MRFSSFVLRNVFRRRARSLLTMTGMAAAVGAVVALVGIADGFHRTILDLYLRRGVDLVVSRADAVSPTGSTLDQKLAIEIAARQEVADVGPGLIDVMSFENLQLTGILMQGWPAGSYTFGDLNLLEGDRLSESYRGKKGIMLGKDLAKNAKLKLNDLVVLVGEEYHVVGIFDSFSGIENNMVIMLLEDAQTLTGKKGVITGCTVKLKDGSPENIQRMQKVIEVEIAGSLNLKGKVRAMTPREVVGTNKQLRAATAMAWITSAVALFIGSLFVLNTMVMSVFERTREIGILRAIGWRPGRVMRMVLMESVVLSLAGGVVGTIGGISLAWGLSRMPWVNGAIQGTISPAIIFQAFLITVVVGLVGAAYPAFRGARLLPTEALRHE